MTTPKRLAPAKVNLYLHVAPPDDKGYHPLQSLVVFADAGDKIALNPKGSGDGLTLHIDGPFAAGLSAGEDNLIVKAVRRFEQAAGMRVIADIHLTKTLPVASGIGGGSADAGAILHLLREIYAPGMPDRDLEDLAAGIGADGVMCLWAKAAIAEGYGERLTPVAIPSLPAVLVNPGVECSTPAVFRQFDLDARFENIQSKQSFLNISSPDAFIAALKTTRNDLEAPAITLMPEIAAVLSLLNAQPETVFARMSGSGATCFALCRSDDDAVSLSRRLDGLLPGAWVRACRLG
ncbi:MAG: 4-(cytidine 5'-diphospho)-2-C-methyl-D-erythritol kinase [Asticcacaulis sp.]|nr:4-(cytidine 5'-diphospho)-2-C-methyl-D-erythritol kinase [Asticcacaulis sp.]